MKSKTTIYLTEASEERLRVARQLLRRKLNKERVKRPRSNGKLLRLLRLPAYVIYSVEEAISIIGVSKRTFSSSYLNNDKWQMPDWIEVMLTPSGKVWAIRRIGPQ